MKKGFSLSTGGVLISDNNVLLVQVNYGVNQGWWMLPGGMVDTGESLEEAVIREMKEETGLLTAPIGILGLRCGVKETGEALETVVHITYEMKYVSGSVKAYDEKEISQVGFMPIDAALSSPYVIDLSKEFIRAACNSKSALLKQSTPLHTNTRYRSYDVYTK